MLRKLSIALLASTFLCGVPAPAEAEPISAAIGLTALLSGTFLAGWGGTIIGVAASIGLSLISSALAPKPDGAPSSSGTTLQTQYGGAVPRQAIVGEQATNGHLVYANVYGPENKVLQAVYVIGDGLHDSLTGIWVNGKLCTLVLSPDAGVTAAGGIQYVVPEFHDGFQDLFSVRFFPGSWDQLADPYLVGDANPAGRWTVNHRGRGICYASITQGWNEELGLTGYPDIRFQVRGLRLYDSREDSTNGGDGPQTWGSQATYEWSDNPSVAEYNYRRGIFINDQCILGMDVLPADLILPMYVAASNDCDEEVALKEGGTEKRYRVGMTISADRQHSEALDVIRGSMAGFTLERAGQFGPLAGVAQIADTDFTITDDDWEVGEKREHSKWRTRSEITTAVHGRFSDPAQKWEAVSFPPRESSVRDAAIGERLSQDIDLTQVSSSSQAQRIAEIQARRSMLGSGSGVLPARFIPLQAGNWIPYNSSRHGNLILLVTTDKLRPEHKVAISYDVIASNVYSWTPAGDELDPPSYGDPGQPGTIILAASGMSAVGVSMPGAGGLVRPGIRFTWTPIGAPSVDRIDFEIRKQGDTEVIPFPANFPSAGSGVATSGIQAATLYEYQHKLSTTPVRETPWSGWASVTSGTDHIVPHALTADTGVDTTFLTLVNDIEVRPLRELERIRQSIAAMGAEEVARSMLADMDRKRGIFTEKVGRREAVAAEAGAREDADEVIQIQVTAVEARVDTAEGSIITNTAAIASTNSALATYQVTVNATLGTHTSQIATNATAISDLDGAFATYRVTVDARFDVNEADIAAAEASIVTNATAIADLDGAFATYQVTVDTRFDTAEANITTNATAISTTNSALSTLTTDVNSKIGAPGNAGSIQASVTSNATALTNHVNGAFASLSTDVTAKIGGSGGTGSIQASVSTNATAIAAIDGTLATTYMVELDGGGRATLTGYTGGGSSGWIFSGNNFQVVTPENEPMLTVANVNGSPATVVNGLLIYDAAIDLRKMDTGAASARVRATHGVIAAGGIATAPAWTNVVSKAITTTNGTIEVRYANRRTHVAVIDNTQPKITLRIVVDGVVQETFDYYAHQDAYVEDDAGNDDWKRDEPLPLPIITVAGLSNASHTVTIEANENGLGWALGTGYLSVDELRKAAT